MTETFYKTETYKPNHACFSGKIYDYEFGGYTSMSDIVSKIISDMKFDYYCKQNLNNRLYKKNQKGIK